jgi:hypothetical protein
MQKTGKNYQMVVRLPTLYLLFVNSPIICVEFCKLSITCKEKIDTSSHAPDGSNLPIDIYVIEVRTSEQTISRQFVKQ